MSKTHPKFARKSDRHAKRMEDEQRGGRRIEKKPEIRGDEPEEESLDFPSGLSGLPPAGGGPESR